MLVLDSTWIPGGGSSPDLYTSPGTDAWPAGTSASDDPSAVPRQLPSRPQTPLGGPCSLYGATPSTGHLWRRDGGLPFPGPHWCWAQGLLSRLPATVNQQERDARHPAPGLQVPGAPTLWPHVAASHIQAPGGAGNTASPSRLLEGKSMNRCALFCRTSPSKTELTATYFSWGRPSSILSGVPSSPSPHQPHDALAFPARRL